MIEITVVICTHNRAKYLARALQSLKTQTVNPEIFEVIVVDNSSSDETPQIANQSASFWPHFQYLREEKLGLSCARNTGFYAARGEVVAYLDDDARAEEGWLEALRKAFQMVPRPSAVGGRSFLDWGGDPPNWIPQEFWSVYSYLDYGNESRFLKSQEVIMGVNMAFPKTVLVKLGGFKTTLGRKGKKLLSGEENEILDKIRLAGGGIYYAAQACVYHQVLLERQTAQWLRTRMFWDGASQPLLDRTQFSGRLNSFYRAQYDLRQAVRFALSAIMYWLQGNKTDVFLNQIRSLQKLGRFRTHVYRGLKLKESEFNQ